MLGGCNMATVAYAAEAKILESLNAAERRELWQFMQRNRTLTVATALLALYEVFYISDTSLVVCRDDMPCPPSAMHITCMPDDVEDLPF